MVATGYNTWMTTRAYLDEAIAAADAGGKFDPHPLAHQFKMTKLQQRAVGAELERMKLVTVAAGGSWQLLDVAREMASALHGHNVDRSSRLGSSPFLATVAFPGIQEKRVAKQPSPNPPKASACVPAGPSSGPPMRATGG